jgi:hypothetical protein
VKALQSFIIICDQPTSINSSNTPLAVSLYAVCLWRTQESEVEGGESLLPIVEDAVLNNPAAPSETVAELADAPTVTTMPLVTTEPIAPARPRARSRSKSKSTVNAANTAAVVSVTEKEDRELGGISGGTYMAFARHGGWLRCCEAAALFCIAQTSFVLSDW